MIKGNLTRDEAISLVGEAAVDAVESKGCEPTNRVGYSGDDLTEWSATVEAPELDGIPRWLVAYYYTSAADAATAEATGDWGAVRFEIAGYEVR
jgi:hypothetical protein